MKKFFEELKKHRPAVDTHYRIGMRVVKTVAAVAICLFIALLLDSWEGIPIMAVSAIVSIQVTYGETVHTGIYRIIGTFIGGVFGVGAVLIGLFLPYYNEGLFIVVIPLMLLINLYLCNFFNLQESCSISCVVTIIVAARIGYEGDINESLMYTLIRVRDTFIGVLVASIMNVLPHYIHGYIQKRKENS